MHPGLMDNRSVSYKKTIDYQSKENLIWGINGHPIWSHDYEATPLQQDIRLIKEHQFTHYRIDVNTDLDGKVRKNRLDRFHELLSLAELNGIEIFPVLRIYEHLETAEFQLTEQESFEMGYRQAKGFVETYRQYFNVYGLGNELDLKLINDKFSGGKLLSDYDKIKTSLTIAYLKGATKAIRELDPDAKTVINASNPYHWGFYQHLKENAMDYDILSIHWYSRNNQPLFDKGAGSSNVMMYLQMNFDKPIWITEINRYEGSKYNKEREQAQMMNLYLENIMNTNIQAFFVYELYDQPFLATQKWTDFTPDYYGIVKWKSSPPVHTEFEYKPVSNVLKFRIQEFKQGQENYIYALLIDLFGHEPNESDLRYWTQELKTFRNKELIINRILEERNSEPLKNLSETHNPENLTSFIDLSYQSFLKRNASEMELNYWSRKLKKRISPTEFLFNLLQSEEYWENAIWEGYERATGFKRTDILKINH